MQEIVINNDYGGFSLSREAVLLARKLSGNPKWGGVTIEGDVYDNGDVCNTDYGFIDDIPRDDKILVEVVKKLGKKANGYLSSLKIVKIPDDVEWEIEEYDGMEWVTEKHRKWYWIMEVIKIWDCGYI